MTKFIAIFDEKKISPPSQELQAAHVKHILQLDDRQILFLCGPFKNHDGILQIFLADSYEQAEQYVLADPFIKEEYFSKYTIYELIESNRENNYLQKKASL
jgi:uncharacterized protein YciI